jgi:hypothetical protein
LKSIDPLQTPEQDACVTVPGIDNAAGWVTGMVDDNEHPLGAVTVTV